MIGRIVARLLALIVILAPTEAAFAQASATLGGTVSDSSGALIPGVTITATNTRTGVVTTTLTNETGTYQFPNLQTGTYKVSAELGGFQTRTYNDVTLGITAVRLNFTLQVGNVAQSVDVNVAVDTLLATSSSSVGTVLPEYKVRDLPLSSRNVLDLVGTTAGAVGSDFAGLRVNQVATLRDGVTVSDGRFDNGVYAVTYTTPDLVDEVRVVVTPADAEYGRGAQVQMSTRAGTNQYRGSIYWDAHNTALDANTWFNNLNGLPTNYLNRQNFGGRVGGPIVKNKTFFFFLYDGQRVRQRESVIANVLTADARNGFFRYFPGVQNGNAQASVPTVDIFGNPVKPSAATGDLQRISVLNKDPLRPGYDTTGWVQRVIAKMPLPNYFLAVPGVGNQAGDGLNVAGYQWVRHEGGSDSAVANGVDVARDQVNLRLDHNFNAKNKIFLTGTREHDWSDGDRPVWPNAEKYTSQTYRRPQTYGASFVSTITSSMVNEFRFGYKRSAMFSWAAYDTPGIADEVRNLILPHDPNGYIINPRSTNFTNYFFTLGAGSRYNLSPQTTFVDNLSWARGKHAFRSGVEIRSEYSHAMQGGTVFPTATLGASAFPVTGINTTNFPGITGTSLTVAQSLLTDLSGSISSVSQQFFLDRASDTSFKDIFEEGRGGKHRQVSQNGFSMFFKDDWKVQPALTLNLGLRYDYYGVPYDAYGLAATPIGQKTGLFGLTGSNFSDMFKNYSAPGYQAGALTQIQFVGKHSTHPDQQITKDDWNNLGPAVGLSWSLPWFGKDKTVLRVGYSITYEGGGRAFSGLDGPLNVTAPGSAWTSSSLSYPQTQGWVTLADIRGPLPRGTPLQVVSLTDRSQSIAAFEDRVVNPYVQNWNLQIQRELKKDLTLELRYVANKGTKLYGAIALNDVNVFENGILQAFNITRAGGNAELFNQMLKGLTISGVGFVDGVTLTGSEALRRLSSSTAANNARALLANGSVGQLASFLNTSTVGTNEAGGLLRNAKLPENFIVTNPQFNGAGLQANPGNSTYNSLQVQVTKRLSRGLTNQTSYTWSRTLGENDQDSTTSAFRNPRNRSIEKALLPYHRTHDFRSNGTFELPFGPGRPFLNNTPAWFSRIVERWQLGGIFSWVSGAPLTITSNSSTFTQGTTGTPDIVGNFTKTAGRVTNVSNGVVYFADFKQVQDPSIKLLPTGTDASTTTYRNSFSNLAIADAQGNILLQNPQPGTLGHLGKMWVEGPTNLGLDMDLIKRVRISETKEFEFRVDAINVLNHPNFANPTAANLNINSTNFGRITSTVGGGAGATTPAAFAVGGAGNRTFIVTARVSF